MMSRTAARSELSDGGRQEFATLVAPFEEGALSAGWSEEFVIGPRRLTLAKSP